jgi:hypothetical protein
MIGESKLGWAHLSHVPLRAEPSDRAECVNEVLAGETVEVLDRGKQHWIQVRLDDGYEGWMDDRQVFPLQERPVEGIIRLSEGSSQWSGVPGGWLPAGALVRFDGTQWWLGNRPVKPLGSAPSSFQGEMIDFAASMLGVPYHWGGRCGWGLDCSGLVQLAAMLTGRSVPRDASQQALVGEKVQSDQIQDNDLAFFQNAEGKVTHVGLCRADGHVIHASGEVRMDPLQNGQLIRHEDGVASHDLAIIRRWPKG